MFFSRQTQDAPEVHNAFPIQLQSPYGCPPDGSDAVNNQKVIAPAKVIPPEILAGVEERYTFSRFRVGRVRDILFRSIASLTGESKVFRIVATPFRKRMDVVHGKGIRRKGFGGSAVFAPAASALRDKLTQPAGDGPSHPCLCHPGRADSQFFH